MILFHSRTNHWQDKFDTIILPVNKPLFTFLNIIKVIRELKYWTLKRSFYSTYKEVDKPVCIYICTMCRVLIYSGIHPQVRSYMSKVHESGKGSFFVY